MGWNTVADGTGTAFAPGAYTACTAKTLYAQWAPDTSTVAYNPNGGTGDPADQTCTAGSTVTLSSTQPTRSGYTFTGWNTAADGSGTGYSGGDAFTLPSSGSDTLYAQWQINSVTLTYDAQGGVGEPGDPYWLNDSCYAWVIMVDPYCCNNEWDDKCQELYWKCYDDNDMDVRDLMRSNSVAIYPVPAKDEIGRAHV